LAHQYLDQLSPKIRSAVLNTAGTFVCFRVGYQDAKYLANEIFPVSKRSNRTYPTYVLTHQGIWPIVSIQGGTTKGEGNQNIQNLTNLPHRYFWTKQRSLRTPSKHKTFDMPDATVSQELVNQVHSLINLSGSQFGKLKIDARRETYDVKIQNDLHQSPGQPEDNIPFWDR
jgi:hypothetical protein